MTGLLFYTVKYKHSIHNFVLNWPQCIMKQSRISSTYVVAAESRLKFDKLGNSFDDMLMVSSH